MICCTTQLYEPVHTDPISLSTLKQGRMLYIKHCSNCHNLYLPQQYNRTNWIILLDSMQERSKITDLEKGIILDYLTYKN